MITTFSQEEISIMGMYRTDSKAHLLADLTAAVPYITDPNAAACVSSAIDKLTGVSEQEFVKFSFVSMLL